MYVGQRLRRREDDRFLKGRGRFVDDIEPAGTAHIAFVRSPHAHARILGVDASAALALPGVLRTLTAADWKAAGLGALTCVHPMPFSDGRPMNEVLRPALAGGKVHHVGDVVAAVVAEDRYAAIDGAEAVAVDYEPLPAVTDIARSLDADAPVLHEEFGSNLIFEIERGDRAATQAAFANADHTVSMTLDTHRVAGSPLEPRAYLSRIRRGDGRYHALGDQPDPALPQALARQVRAPRPRAQAPRDLARCRRRVRAEDPFRGRGLDRGLGLDAAQAPGQVDLDPGRGADVGRPGARPPHEGADGLRR